MTPVIFNLNLKRYQTRQKTWQTFAKKQSDQSDLIKKKNRTQKKEGGPKKKKWASFKLQSIAYTRGELVKEISK